MIVKIVGGNFDNHGDHLMLIAAVSALRMMKPQPLIVSGIRGFDTYLDRAKLGLYQSLWQRRGLRISSLVGEPILRRYGRPFGIVADQDVNAVLDMSGYAYADRWGPENVKHRLREYALFKKRSKPIIFLPQAFGPFSPDGVVAPLAKSLLQFATRVYARDRSSFDAVVGLTGARSVTIAPEFSQVVKPIVPEEFERMGEKTIALVPNIQMVKQGGAESFEEYIQFLSRVTREIAALGWLPFVIQFSRSADLALITEFNRLHPEIPVLRSDDPLTVKLAIGRCYGAVCSRYHALVSALSQGVPAMATSWSHKYTEFLADYGIPNNVLAVSVSDEELRERLMSAFDHNREVIVSQLKSHAQQACRLIHAMWCEVAQALGVTYATPDAQQ